MNNLKNVMYPKYTKAKGYLDYLKEDPNLTKEEKEYSKDCFNGSVKLMLYPVKMKDQPPYITKHF